MNANVAAIRTRAEAELSEQFAAARERLPGSARVSALRVESFERFQSVGLPSRRLEAWHFTDLRSSLRDALAPVEAEAQPTGASIRSLCSDSIRIELVDGFYRAQSAEAALPPGLRVRSLAEALACNESDLIETLAPAGLESDPMVALNAAMMAGGVVIDVAPGARIQRPIELIWLAGAAAEGRAAFARSLVRLGAGAAATLVESGEMDAPRQINSVLVAALSERARLDHIFVSPALRGSSLRVDSLLASLGADARLVSTALVARTPFLRRQACLRFDGPRGEARLAGLALLRGSEHADNTLVVLHVAPHCKSRELFKHIVDDKATGVFQGKIVVAPGAQKTDGSMASRAILLSDEAAMDNKPELEIFADDVLCGHGATCGELDHDQLFYAMSRGLPPPEAEALLLEAFAGEALDFVENESLREALGDRMRAWLAQRGS